MKNWIFLSVIIVCGLFQATILNYVRIFAVKPDFLFSCAVLAGVFFNAKWSLSLSLSAGLIKDILGAEPFGFNMLLFVSWCYIVSKLSKKVSIEDNFVLAVLMFIVVVCNDIIVRFIFLSFGRYISPGIFLRITLIESVYTSLFLFLLTKTLDYFKFFPVYRSERAKSWIDEAKNF